jgi:hypothetical protein
MFSGIPVERFGRMTPAEARLFDNAKKAFSDSDEAYVGGRVADCMEPLCKAVDVAKTLRRSLRGEDVSPTENKKRFKEFIDLEVPTPGCGGLQVRLTDARTGRAADYSFSDLVYAIRCMVHENENLNAAEAPDYHILLEWRRAPSRVTGMAAPVSGSATDLSLAGSLEMAPDVAGNIDGGRVTLNGHFVWGRVREIVSKFVTGVDLYVGLTTGAEKWSITIRPPLGSVRPGHRYDG